MSPTVPSLDPSNTGADGSAGLALIGELTIYRAAELRTQLLAALDAGRSLAIDLSGVTEIDTAGLQLLLVTARTALARGVTVQLLRPSDAVVEVLELVNLGAVLEAADKPRLGVS